MINDKWYRRGGLPGMTALVMAWLFVTATGTGSAAGASLTTVPLPSDPSTPGVSHPLSSTKHTARVGALFQRGPANGHHCTAGVVNSPGRNIIVTAAHCLGGRTADAVFVPGYIGGSAPYGTWSITKVTVSEQWASWADEDSDVAFATVAPLNGRAVQEVVGGYRLGIRHSTTGTVQLVGYPSATDTPIICANTISAFGATQLRIGCTAFTGGTSGTPWVTDLDPDTGAGTVMGVVGGYQEGGDTADVSYSAAFGTSVLNLYRRAISSR